MKSILDSNEDNFAQTLKLNNSSDFMNSEGYHFLKKATEPFVKNTKNLVNVIMVAPSYDSDIPMVETLNSQFKIAALIPKNSTIIRRSYIIKKYKDIGIKVASHINKNKLKDSKEAINFINKVIPLGEKFIIMDHGGYFSHSAEIICKEFPDDQFLGFTEYTDNGHKKYTKQDGITRPIISTAHSYLKEPSDREAGESVTHVLDHVLRDCFGLKAKSVSQLSIGVVGFGRLGKGVAEQLRRRGVSNIRVADKSYRQLINAPSLGFHISSIEEICKACNVIISATGSAALKPSHYSLMKNNTLITTVTSPDDELKIDDIIRDKVIVDEKDRDLVTSYTVKSTGKKIHLLLNGESANTLLKSGIGDPSIFLPIAAQLVANLILVNQRDRLGLLIQSIDESYEEEIAKCWNNCFYG
ncbi:hypothetical protein BS333_03365 [Vibrio azureus]|uniref:S-adenosyl-L-homocysteine hydrolase NAD binding domain-containing protein n=1 Tax=Vibrio azureus NBRC 104587 TaxID=1219077 RepID=U3AQ40_9VIBR|nr:NAD(P)-dependent oxidoreductase [Vibrio azureus]AUI85497.1 hypothetical protein BS333_03365 [Vibrio azureus]GAD75407.1 hypothetical protein VAZ01S_025_00020 [Vibrio azureus NBRC 104587]